MNVLQIQMVEEKIENLLIKCLKLIWHSFYKISGVLFNLIFLFYLEGDKYTIYFDKNILRNSVLVIWKNLPPKRSNFPEIQFQISPTIQIYLFFTRLPLRRLSSVCSPLNPRALQNPPKPLSNLDNAFHWFRLRSQSTISLSLKP